MSIHLVLKERSARAELFASDGQHRREALVGGGGGDGIRTHDRLVANQVLYQLSYAPNGGR